MAKFITREPFDLNEFLASSSLFEFFDEAVPTTVTLTKVEATNTTEGTEQLTLTGAFSAQLDEDGYPTSGTITGLKFTSTAGVSIAFTGLSLTVDEFVTYIEGDDLAGLFASLLSGDDVVRGSSGVDVLYSFGGADILNGLAGADTMAGGDGDDLYFVDDAGDTVVELAGEGIDQVRASIDYTLGANVEILTLQGAARVGTGNELDNTIFGAGGADTLSGLDGNDILRGKNARDELLGGGGQDLLDGGVGKDTMTGGSGRDTFQFRDGDFGTTRAVADVITDFDQGANEKIQLNLVDANTTAGGNQAFTWLGNGAFTGVAGQLHYVQQGGNTYVEGDLDGDSVADIFIALTGTINLTAGDFVL